MRWYVFIFEGHIKQKQAAFQIHLSCRQVRRLANCYRQGGAKGLIPGNRGKASNRKFSEAFKEQVIALVRKHYWGFGPTFAAEKLGERDGLKVSAKTLRGWMIKEGTWKSRSKKKVSNQLLQTYNIHATRDCGLPDVWINNEKIAALGIRVSQGIAWYGMALNIHPDLTWFDKINPCGTSRKATSIQKGRPTHHDVKMIAYAWHKHFLQQLCSTNNQPIA